MQFLTDLPRLASLEAKGEYGAFVRFQAAHQLLNGIEKGDRLLRRRLALEAGPQSFLILDAGVSDVAANAPILAGTLADGDAGEDVPDIIPSAQLEMSVLATTEETAEDRLHDILRIDARANHGIEPFAGEGDQAMREAMKDGASSCIVACTKLGKQVEERKFGVHQVDLHDQRDCGVRCDYPMCAARMQVAEAARTGVIPEYLALAKSTEIIYSVSSNSQASESMMHVPTDQIGDIPRPDRGVAIREPRFHDGS
jgi:hypothetical protein